MNTIKFISVALILPFVIGSSCVNSVFVEVDFDLNHCPSVQSDLPHVFHRVGSTLDPDSFFPVCRDLKGYTYKKFNEKSQVKNSIDGYIKLVRSDNCAIRVITKVSCGDKDKCEDKNIVVSPESITRATLRASEFVNLLWEDEEIKFLKLTNAFPIVTVKNSHQWCMDQN